MPCVVALLACAVALLPAHAVGRRSAPKRGFSGFLGPDYNCSDAAALHLDSWYYNWLHEPSQRGDCGPAGAPEFVPMIIGLGEAEKVRRWDVRSICGGVDVVCCWLAVH